MEDNLIDSCLYDFKDIPGSESWIRLCEITQGNSLDRKFYVKNSDRQRYFLRLADPTHYDRKKKEFEHLKAACAMGAAVPAPVGFGLCAKGRSIYLQTEWIYGRPGADELTGLDKFKQYELGTAAGLNLKLIHHCPIPPIAPASWEALQLKRWNRIHAGYRGCRHKIAYDQKILGLIKENLPLLANRPQRLLHGGFDLDNVVLSYENSLSLIDFEQWQFGDPLFDLANVLTRIRQVSVPYAIGILDCYFAFDIGDLELRLMTLYGAVSLIEQVVDAAKVSSDSLPAALEQVQVLIRDLQGCRNICPIWYKRMRAMK